MRLPNHRHTEAPWRVHALAAGFPLEDLWEFPVRLDAARGQTLAEFERFLHREAFPRLTRRGPARWLFALRAWLGRRLGWDAPRGAAGVGAGAKPAAEPAAESLAQRLPADLRGAESPTLGGRSLCLYALEDETLRELRNGTVHALIQLGRLPDKQWPGHHVVRLAVYARPRGRLGRVYMAAIRPFRHWIVYPTLMRQTARHWPAYAAALTGSGAAAGATAQGPLRRA